MSTGKFDHTRDHWSMKPSFDLYPWDDDHDAEPNTTDIVSSETLWCGEDLHLPVRLVVNTLTYDIYILLNMYSQVLSLFHVHIIY